MPRSSRSSFVTIAWSGPLKTSWLYFPFSAPCPRCFTLILPSLPQAQFFSGWASALRFIKSLRGHSSQQLKSTAAMLRRSLQHGKKMLRDSDGGVSRGRAKETCVAVSVTFSPELKWVYRRKCLYNLRTFKQRSSRITASPIYGNRSFTTSRLPITKYYYTTIIVSWVLPVYHW